MNRLIQYFVNEFVVNSLAKNKAFQSAVMRAARYFGDSTPKSAKALEREAAEAAKAAARAKAEQQAAAKVARGDPRNKGFFGHLGDAVRRDLDDLTGRGRR